MWNRIFLAAMIVFLFGTIAFLLGEHIRPGWKSVTFPVGAMLMGISGIAAAISGSVMILAADARVKNHTS